MGAEARWLLIVIPDRAIVELDRILRTLFVRPESRRQVPGGYLPEAEMSLAERRHAVGLMRVNHCGEVCAQALYQGQALTARQSEVRDALKQAGQEEVEHLAWAEHRIQELGGRTSYLNPLWYAGSLAIGLAAGACGERWNLGFLAETERQVEAHLEGHLSRLPEQDRKTRAIVGQMKADEARHADAAVSLGAAELPAPAKLLMRFAAKVMTRTAYYV